MFPVISSLVSTNVCREIRLKHAWLRKLALYLVNLRVLYFNNLDKLFLNRLNSSSEKQCSGNNWKITKTGLSPLVVCLAACARPWLAASAGAGSRPARWCRAAPGPRSRAAPPPPAPHPGRTHRTLHIIRVSNEPSRRLKFQITEKAPSRAFS